ncbi:carbohydrate ABC transporter permease [Intrasporangium calvum]|uniref:Carbohydrate ABC transporter membrane protein 2, CUT1 family n=1 Tax=Intrasporangium calvum (strain ATCC 23552 / DSM 43043 / JCM 3097 / NBRC 12989 / NCIMB 10167 / NRRL B-3866 / 7 KIP) TaxID=710696 RepID=E6S7J6_INTC7|nr:carbohydrate ABC transporter permease [Intrasporangium calvum]ADU46891.1 carbohydrate ABC transporter membrane protein 2, CUT1 family [Intrasporangium calvum DSM 43043]AXG12171.1 carbohydrate ABC transporter permease [Intrasporangium calvum]
MPRLYPIFKYAFITVWACFVAGPFLWALTTSFKDDNGVQHGATYLPWVQYRPTTLAWRNIFGGAGGVDVIKPFLNSLIVTVSASVVALILGSLAAYGLSRYTYRFGPMKNPDIVFFFVSQRIMPPIVLVIPFFFLLQFGGLLDSIPGLVIVTVSLLLPISVWVMVDFFDNIPKEIDEMAMLEGCTPLGAFTRAILPNSLPGLTVAAMFCAVFGWNDFFFAFRLTFTEVQTLPQAVVALNSSIPPWWTLSAASLFGVAPLVLLAIMVERYLSKGNLSGAVR